LHVLWWKIPFVGFIACKKGSISYLPILAKHLIQHFHIPKPDGLVLITLINIKHEDKEPNSTFICGWHKGLHDSTISLPKEYLIQLFSHATNHGNHIKLYIQAPPTLKEDIAYLSRSKNAHLKANIEEDQNIGQPNPKTKIVHCVQTKRQVPTSNYNPNH
jgi:hypothetical protein